MADFKIVGIATGMLIRIDRHELIYVFVAQLGNKGIAGT